MTKKEWRTVQIPEGIVRQIEKYLKTEEAKNLGITSISSYVTFTLRKELTR